MELSTTEVISARGRESHTACSPKVRAKNQARGRIHTSCLATDIIRLYTPLPRAWTVSYTHLDVYKRQAQVLVISA